jgi:hypothetical protein
MSYSFCELSIKIKVPLLSVVSDCISLPKIGWRKTRNMAKKINLHPQTKTRI